MDKNIFVKENVLKVLGGPSKAAEFFDCRSQAISQWPNGKSVPELRQYQLKEKMPDVFGEAA